MSLTRLADNSTLSAMAAVAGRRMAQPVYLQLRKCPYVPALTLRQLGWTPDANDKCLVPADKVFIKHGYLPPKAAIDYLKDLAVDRVLVCGIQADTCCLAAGFMLFDAGLRPTLLKWLSVGSSLDRSATLAAKLWKHHFGCMLSEPSELLI